MHHGHPKETLWGSTHQLRAYVGESCSGCSSSVRSSPKSPEPSHSGSPTGSPVSCRPSSRSPATGSRSPCSPKSSNSAWASAWPTASGRRWASPSSRSSAPCSSATPSPGSRSSASSSSSRASPPSNSARPASRGPRTAALPATAGAGPAVLPRRPGARPCRTAPVGRPTPGTPHHTGAPPPGLHPAAARSAEYGPRAGSDVVVELELARVRTQPDRVDLHRALVVDVRLDQVLGEDTALHQVLVVLLQVVQRLLQRRRHLLDLRGLLRRQLVEVLVQRLRRLDLVLDP